MKKVPNLQVVESAPLRYLISLPTTGTGFNGAKSPVLCFLHGYGEAAPLEIREALTLHGPLQAGPRPRLLGQFIVVAPQLPAPGDIWFRHYNAVRQVVNEAQVNHGGDPLRTYLTGFSYVANGVFDLALLDPFFWAALWPVDPTRLPLRDPLRPVWLCFGGASRDRKDDFIRALGLAAEDQVSEGDRVYMDQGQDHVGSARLAYRQERIYSWLLTKQLVTEGSA